MQTQTHTHIQKRIFFSKEEGGCSKRTDGADALMKRTKQRGKRHIIPTHGIRTAHVTIQPTTRAKKNLPVATGLVPNDFEHWDRLFAIGRLQNIAV